PGRTKRRAEKEDRRIFEIINLKVRVFEIVNLKVRIFEIVNFKSAILFLSAFSARSQRELSALGAVKVLVSLNRIQL
ncbi:MAG TPA: hypothetical protein VK388_02740, partial [Pyrinomonadaceae bacterium]|nr:hypothetical protein [Pyrinomonadaceae bacterium]